VLNGVGADPCARRQRCCTRQFSVWQQTRRPLPRCSWPAILPKMLAPSPSSSTRRSTMGSPQRSTACRSWWERALPADGRHLLLAGQKANGWLALPLPAPHSSTAAPPASDAELHANQANVAARPGSS
jgi:hypothetical protein